MYCTKCGVELQDSPAYCPTCGTPTGQRQTFAAGNPPRLTRSIYDVKIAGVCAGLAQYIGMDPTLVRLVWLIVTICFPPFLLGYFAAWIIVPREAPRAGFAFGAGVPNPQS